MPANKISLNNAKQNKLFYFVANVVVYRESDSRCLILKRSEREKAHPGIYGVIGGKLEWGDLDMNNPTRMNRDIPNFENIAEKLLAREVKEEAGIKIGSDIHYINSLAFVRPDEVPVVLVKFGAKYTSGDVVLEEGSFTDFAWVNEEEIKSYNCIEGIADEVAETIRIFKQ